MPSANQTLCSMKITLDHNCIIDIESGTPEGLQLRRVIEDDRYQSYVVNVGAWEMLQRGVVPGDYSTFEALLQRAEIDHLPRLNPMALVDIAYINRCVIANDEMIDLAQRIRDVLFPVPLTPDEMIEKKRRNRLCDVHTLWCHIHNKHEVFVTSDQNFLKASRVAGLAALGVGRVCLPSDLLP